MPDVLSIKGGAPLKGTVSVAGAKNSALPLLFATLLTNEPCTLFNVPNLDDIAVTLRMLKQLGAEAEFNSGKVKVHAKNLHSTTAPYGLVKALRASFWVLGPLLAREGRAEVALPGGDAIGTRPVDLHIDGLIKLGADVRLKQGVVFAKAPGKLRGEKVSLAYPSVGATHHLLLTAALIPEETIIEGAAREPEVIQLAEFLSKMGATIEGAGTSVIKVLGKSELSGAETTVLPDRIEAATYLCAGAATGGDVCVEGIDADTLGSTRQILENAGCEVVVGDNSIRVKSPENLEAASFSTAPAPGLATDVQPLLMAALVKARGVSTITETVFENRFGHVAEFRRLGADISIDGRIAKIKGVEKLSGAPVDAGDIRAAAGLVILGLMAEGCTQLREVYHLDRGYENVIEKFKSLGANISREPEYEENDLILGC